MATGANQTNGTYSEKNQMTEMPMRVVLISQTGAMRTTWLPSSMEGRYKFLDRNGIDDLPFYIESNAGRWVAYSGRSAAFVRTDGLTGAEVAIGQSVVLADQMMLNLRYNDAKYAIYAEVDRPGSFSFLPYYLEERSDYMIGRLEDCELYYPNLTVSRNHAKFHWDGNGWQIIDLNSTNGVYVNGRRVTSQRLNVGDIVFIVGLYILIGSGFVAMNNANQRVYIRTPRIRPVQKLGDVVFPTVNIESFQNDLYDRQPRKLKKISEEPITIEKPPMPMSANKIPLALRLGSPVAMGGRALMSGNIFSMLTSTLFPVMTQGLTEKDRKDYEAKRHERYREYLVYKQNEIINERVSEETLLNENYPELNKALNFALTRNRLWERRKTDDDFLKIRVGYGRIPMLAPLDYEPKKFQLEPDTLEDEMYALVERPHDLNNAPVMVSLMEDHILGVRGGKKAQMMFFRNLILQIALTHSYDEVKIVLLANPVDAEELDFVRYLPHNWDNERELRFFATDQTDVQQITKHLNNEIEKAGDDGKKFSLKTSTTYVIIATDKKLYESVETIHTILDHDKYVGFSIIAAFDGLPKECVKIVNLNQDGFRIIDYLHPEATDQEFTLDQGNTDLIHRSLVRLMQTKLMMEGSSFALPGTVTFLEMYNAGKVEHLNPLKRWADNNPVKSLAAPVGIGTDGQLFNLDLHEKRQGPHGLVAGMTGSGKSEFIITYILSMAVNYSPDEVAFVLIDYKGGGLADAFVDEKRGIHLPHVVATITNLDGAAIQRSLVSINSELKRRQDVFRQAKSETNEGTMDIYDYQKLYRNGRVKEPMPHLFIISDEFAELKSQQPEFMDELISTARIGRSLGVHLILATQKPSGVVNDQIWSNTKFRVCLRVQDRSDSMEMLKRPEAAEIKSTGRFYLQVGYNELFALGQSAWCGAEYMPQEEVIVEADHSVEFVDNAGQTILTAKPKVTRQSTGVKQIVSIVQYLSDLAKRENIVPRSLWMDPLPKVIELDSMLGTVQRPQGEGIYAVLGMIDDPEHQTQYPYIQDMIDFHSMMLVGTSGSGKSTYLRTMLYSLVEHYSPKDINYYILDLSNKMLNSFAYAPHCGAYLTEENEEDVPRLLQMIGDIIKERKELFAKAEVGSFEAYRRIEQIPLVLVVVDSYMNLPNLSTGENFLNSIQKYLREGANFGIRFIFTCNHTNEIAARVKQEIDLRVALQAADRYVYGDILEAKCKSVPAEANGRGMCVVDGRPLEYHTALLDSELPEQDRAPALRERLRALAKEYEGIPSAPRLLMVDFNQTYEEFCESFEPGRVPLGFAYGEMKAVSVPFKQMRSMSIFFGNPKGILPITKNLLYAAKRSGMEVIVVRKNSGSVFDEMDLSEYPFISTVLRPDEESVPLLSERILNEIRARNVFRDEYCEANGIPSTASGRALKAEAYIREKSVPLWVIFESFYDFCAAVTDEEQEGYFNAFFESVRGYNMYFTGFFYPDEDSSLNRHALVKCFNKDEFQLYFGGRYNKTPFANVPYNVTKIDMMNPEYNQYLLKYQSAYHTMVMPCGTLEQEAEDPDEAAII